MARLSLETASATFRLSGGTLTLNAVLADELASASVDPLRWMLSDVSTTTSAMASVTTWTNCRPSMDSMDSMADRDELALLRAENRRLIALLESQGIEWRAGQQSSPAPAESARLSADEKVALFRRLFRGRTDV
jgi:hypothetical protein